MNTEHNFIAERALANHCPELLAKSINPEDRENQINDLAEGFCRALPERLQPLLIGKKPSLSAEKYKTQTAASLMQEIGREAANYSLDFGPAYPKILLSFDVGNAVALTDRLFGGTGKPENAPAMLPQSASMALERIARACAAALVECWNFKTVAPKIESDSNIVRLSPFPRGQYCVNWQMEIAQADLGTWPMRLALLESQLDLIVTDRKPQSEKPAQHSIEEMTTSGPFSGIPLNLNAILSEMDLPLPKIAAFAVGDILPLSPLREIPLRIAGKTLATGNIGAIDGQIALRLKTICASKQYSDEKEVL